MPPTPAASRLLQKPLNVLPHGGGQPIQPNGPEAMRLAEWAALVAAAACN
ncbi:MAG TPA: hypothetical protein VNO26_08095 [Candidatus Limnocylindria bacterium]|nr:hypothetical protein [Candidatus Limnocylindria bacterium]